MVRGTSRWLHHFNRLFVIEIEMTFFYSFHENEWNRIFPIFYFRRIRQTYLWRTKLIGVDLPESLHPSEITQTRRNFVSIISCLKLIESTKATQVNVNKHFHEKKAVIRHLFFAIIATYGCLNIIQIYKSLPLALYNFTEQYLIVFLMFILFLIFSGVNFVSTDEANLYPFVLWQHSQTHLNTWYPHQPLPCLFWMH